VLNAQEGAAAGTARGGAHAPQPRRRLRHSARRGGEAPTRVCAGVSILMHAPAAPCERLRQPVTVSLYHRCCARSVACCKLLDANLRCISMNSAPPCAGGGGGVPPQGGHAACGGLRAAGRGAEGARRDGVRDAGAVRPPRPHAALRQCPRGGGRSPGAALKVELMHEFTKPFVQNNKLQNQDASR
jgi:hypothetical protein